MAAEDSYSRDAAEALDRAQVSASELLWEALCDVLDLIFEQPDSAEARRQQLRHADRILWKVDVRNDDLLYCVLWHSTSAGPKIAWVKLWPPT